MKGFLVVVKSSMIMNMGGHVAVDRRFEKERYGWRHVVMDSG